MKLYKNNEKPVKQGIKNTHKYYHPDCKITSLIFDLVSYWSEYVQLQSIGQSPNIECTNYKILVKSNLKFRKQLDSPWAKSYDPWVHSGLKYKSGFYTLNSHKIPLEINKCYLLNFILSWSTITITKYNQWIGQTVLA